MRTILMLMSVIVVTSCIDPDPPFSQLQRDCISRTVEERSEDLSSSCQIIEMWGSLQNFTGEV